MKRILIFTCMVFVAVSVCFAAELTADGYNRTDNTMAQTVVTLTMDGTSDTNQEVIQLYFTSADPSEATTPPTATRSVSLGFNGDTIAENSDNSLYVWWKIVSGGNYDIQLGIDAPLVNTKENTPDQKLGWSASWIDTESAGEESEILTATDDNTVSSGDTADYAPSRACLRASRCILSDGAYIPWSTPCSTCTGSPPVSVHGRT